MMPVVLLTSNDVLVMNSWQGREEVAVRVLR